jgi:hypothetical protein
MRVAVENEVGPVRADRSRQAGGAEERPDRLRLADEGLWHRRVVQEHDAPVTAGDRLQPRLERLHLTRRLVVDLAQERLAEIGQLGAGEAADEPFQADDPDLEPVHLEDVELARQHAHAGVCEQLDELEAAVRVVVVVAEHRVHGEREPAARIGEDDRLLRFAVRRQIPR